MKQSNTVLIILQRKIKVKPIRRKIKMKGYKAFQKGLICRGKQYAENTVFEEDQAEICQSGMHFCKDPLDVLNYYPLVDENGSISEFAEVEALDAAYTNDEKKFVTKKLRIGARISFDKLVQAAVRLDLSKDTLVSDRVNNSEDDAQIGSSGYGAQIGSSGDGAQIGSSGDDARIISTGKNSVICCAGDCCMAKGKKGSWITLSEWKYSKKDGAHIPVCVKTVKIDGVKIKEDAFYKLVNKKIVEVK